LLLLTLLYLLLLLLALTPLLGPTTPWNRVFEKTIVAQVLKKFIAFYEIIKIIPVFTTAPDPIPSQINPVDTLTVYFKITHPRPGLSNCLFPSNVPD
jgi:hypothetical protein